MKPLPWKTNQEDGCTGRFWEGRFRSQALLDERALLACMAYVDLNPIRAKMATTPETSEHTAVKVRIKALESHHPIRPTIEDFVGSNSETIGLPFRLMDYLKLVDWTGRILRNDKRGAIDSDLPPILKRLSITQDAWQLLTTKFEDQFHNWVGSEHITRRVCMDKHYQRIPSTINHRRLFD